MKTLSNTFLLIVAIILPLQAQNNDSVQVQPLPVSAVDFPETTTVWKTAMHSNSLNIIPLSALFGRASVTYEHLISGKHGALMEGSYGFGTDYDITAGYRYHYYSEQDQSGLISPYWGFFVHKGKSTGSFEDPDSKIKYDLNTEILTIGVHWGERFAWGTSFNYSWRIGYGYPVILDLNWPQGKPENYKTVEKIIKVFSGFDSELSVGILF